jgi:hypothetical protein
MDHCSSAPPQHQQVHTLLLPLPYYYYYYGYYTIFSYLPGGSGGWKVRSEHLASHRGAADRFHHHYTVTYTTVPQPPRVSHTPTTPHTPHDRHGGVFWESIRGVLDGSGSTGISGSNNTLMSGDRAVLSRLCAHKVVDTHVYRYLYI